MDFLGRILSIVLVGLVVDLVGRVMLAISFFHLPDFLPSNEERLSQYKKRILDLSRFFQRFCVVA